MAELRPDAPVTGVRTLEHAAEVAIEAVGGTLAECLARLAAGLFALIFLPPAAPPTRTIEVDLEAEDTGELAVAWLEELLYRSEVEDLYPVRFEVETDGHHLRSRADGVPRTDEVEAAGPEVKAVTRHGLEVRRTEDGWLARVLLDV